MLGLCTRFEMLRDFVNTLSSTCSDANFLILKIIKKFCKSEDGGGRVRFITLYIGV